MNDVLSLLADANPVRVEDIAPLELPSHTRRAAPSLRLVVALVLAAAVATSLIGVFLGGTSSHRGSSGTGAQGLTGGVAGPTGPNGPPGPTIARPLGSGMKVTLPVGAGVIGLPLVLPDTPLVSPADVGPVWAYGLGPNRGIVAVTYPDQGLIVEYERPHGNTDYAAMAKGSPGLQVIDLGGTPGLAYYPDDIRDNFGAVTFAVGEIEVRVLGHQDAPTLEAIARSILDRTGSPQGTPGIIAPAYPPVDLAALSDELGKPVVLPRTSFVQPSDAESAWTEGDCSHFCDIRILFPTHGLTVSYYSSPGKPDSRAGFEEVARNVRFGDGDAIDLDGVPAILIMNADPMGLGSIAFLWNGMRIEVDGFENADVLTDLARSMLDQLRGTSSGPFTAQPGVDFFPIVPPKQIDLSHASATLGQPVVLPDTAAVQPSDAATAWAEGQCPHASTSSSDGHSGCAVWVKFPAKSLTIVYERPGGIGSGMDERVTEMSGAHLVDMGGLSALAVDRNAEGRSPGWFEFAIDGTRVIIRGDHDAATLQAIARSIVDRSK